MSKSIRQRLLEGMDEPPSHWSRFSALSEGDKEQVIEDCRELTSTIYDGLLIYSVMQWYWTTGWSAALCSIVGVVAPFSFLLSLSKPEVAQLH